MTKLVSLFFLVRRTGLEPATSWSQTKYTTDCATSVLKLKIDEEIKQFLFCGGGGIRTTLMRPLGYEPSEMTNFSTPRYFHRAKSAL